MLDDFSSSYGTIKQINTDEVMLYVRYSIKYDEWYVDEAQTPISYKIYDRDETIRQLIDIVVEYVETKNTQ